MNLKYLLMTLLSVSYISSFTPMPISSEENMFPGNAIGGGGSGSSAEIVGVGTDVIQQVPPDGIIGTGSADGTASSDSQTTVVVKEPPTINILFQTKSPTATESLPYSGSVINWGPPANLTPKVAYDDGMWVQAPLNLMSHTEYLYSYAYGFTIPAGATIVGVQLKIKKEGASSPDVFTKDHKVSLIYGGVPMGLDKARPEYFTNWVYTTYGSAADSWGNSLTPTMVNSAQFGSGCAFTFDDSSGYVNVDHVEMTIYYIEN